MKNITMSQRYKLSKMNNGGFFKRNPDGSYNTQEAGAYAGMAAGLVDAVDPGDQYGVQSTGGAMASGALSGAAAGAALGPVGMGIGAVLGAGAKLFGNNAAKKEKEHQIQKATDKLQQNKEREVAVNIAMNPSVKGNSQATMFRNGGSIGSTLKGKPAGKFAMKGTIVSAYRATKSLLPTVAVNPNKMENGGIVPVDNEGRAEVVGPSHEKGGVKVPSLGVELEGGETVDGDFVFSKELGFAKEHKKILKAIKGMDKDDSPLANYTRTLLDKKEENLKLEQEETKQSLGLPNETDMISKEYKKYLNGGTLNKDKNKKPSLLDLPRIGSVPSILPTLTSAFKSSTNTPEEKSSLPVTDTAEPAVTAPSSSETRKSRLPKASDVAPFVTNLANSFRKLPSVPEPTYDQESAPRYVDFSNQRNEVARQVRGANQVAQENLASGNATSATIAANLAQGIRATNAVNEAEANTNIQIANRTEEMNRQTRSSNNLKTDYRNAQGVSRSLKQQELNSENLANLADKIQLVQRDKKIAADEDIKLLLTLAQDNTGASWRAASDVFKTRLSPEAYAKLNKQMELAAKASEAEKAEILRTIMNSAGKVDNTKQSVVVKEGKTKTK